MASAFSHAVIALSIGTCFYRSEIPKRVWLVGMVCAALPDLDVIGFRLGIRYGDFWGHRGFTHSLLICRPSRSLRRNRHIPTSHPRNQQTLSVRLAVLNNSQSRHTRRDDQRRPPSRLLLALRQSSLFSAMETDSRLAHRRRTILHSARIRHPPKRIHLDLDSRNPVRITGVANTPQQPLLPLHHHRIKPIAPMHSRQSPQRPIPHRRPQINALA